jgi:hypothetical protein
MLFADLEAGGVLAATPEGGGALAGGAVVRATVGFQYLSFGVGLAALSPATIDVSGTSARITRIPIDFTVRGALRLRRVELAADIGFVGVVTLGEGVNLAVPDQGTRFDPALRFAVILRVWFKERVAPWLAFESTVSLHPIDLLVNPMGNVGSTPRLWLSPILGLAVKLK